MASLLTICQSAADEIGLQRPTLIVGSTNYEARRLLRMANKEGYDLSRRADWQVLVREQTFTSVATETQTNMIPSDWGRFINETFWNRTRKLPFYGPVDSRQWQQVKSWSSSPVTHTFRVRGGNIILSPVPSAGDTFAFEYVTSQWCEDDQGVGQVAFEADTDVTRLDAELMILGIIWRFKQGAGIAGWDADYSTYDAAVRQKITQDQPQRTLNMAGQNARPFPGIGVPDGSWDL